MVFVVRWHDPEPAFPGGPASGERLRRQKLRSLLKKKMHSEASRKGPGKQENSWNNEMQKGVLAFRRRRPRVTPIHGGISCFVQASSGPIARGQSARVSGTGLPCVSWPSPTTQRLVAPFPRFGIAVGDVAGRRQGMASP